MRKKVRSKDVTKSKGCPMVENAEAVVFCRRVSDGKFYRGGFLWRWCRRWRRAAALPRSFWRDEVLPNLGQHGRDCDLVEIGDVPSDLVNRIAKRRHVR